jgi:hypothetical protein
MRGGAMLRGTVERSPVRIAEAYDAALLDYAANPVDHLDLGLAQVLAEDALVCARHDCRIAGGDLFVDFSSGSALLPGDRTSASAIGSMRKYRIRGLSPFDATASMWTANQNAWVDVIDSTTAPLSDCRSIRPGKSSRCGLAVRGLRWNCYGFLGTGLKKLLPRL